MMPPSITRSPGGSDQRPKLARESKALRQKYVKSQRSYTSEASSMGDVGSKIKVRMVLE